MPDSAEDDYFNDLSQQPSNCSGGDADARNGSLEDGSSAVPKPKRIACVLCRKRKLRCDGDKPACGTCKRLQHDCSYDEVRRKSGPKRGYVKALEARLAQVETLLKTQDDVPTARKDGSAADGDPLSNNAPELYNGGMAGEYIDIRRPVFGAVAEKLRNRLTSQSPPQAPLPSMNTNGTTADPGSASADVPVDDYVPWEMISLGLEEPLPLPEVMAELTQIYFDRIHPSLPMIHRPRFYAALSLSPNMRPPVCLRYAMWANAAAITEKYESLQEHFYLRARKYVQQDEMKGHGESMITVAHCQTWTLLGSYEFKLMYFPRAWMSAGRATRLGQMMGLQRLDGTGLDVKQCLPPARDWAEREERRRTFWAAFCIDRYSSIGTGWPMTIDERDIGSDLPCDDRSFDTSSPAQSITLAQALEPAGPHSLNSFAGVILMACLFGRNLTHLHRPSPHDNDADMNGEFWKRHREMDNILLNTSLALPDELRLPSGLNDSNVVFMNMNLHTSTICLHQAAIFKADKNRLPGRVSAESKVRCITAAAEIASIMRQVSHMDVGQLNPFISFCLYVAARVFVQYLRSRPKDAQVKSSLQFLLVAMHAIKRKNPLTESFLVQLDVDIESAGLEDAAEIRARMAAIPERPPRPGAPLPPKDCPGAAVAHPFDPPKKIPTYGDGSFGTYNNPNGDKLPSPNPSFDGPTACTVPGFDLPSRQRTPAPNTFYSSEMDTSPDATTAPNPTTTSASSISSSSISAPRPHHQPLDFDPIVIDPTSFSPDYSLHNFLASSHPADHGFVIPDHAWDTAAQQATSTSTSSLTPPSHATSSPSAGAGSGPATTNNPPAMPSASASAAAAAASAQKPLPTLPGIFGSPPAINDLMQLSDAEWSQIFEGLPAQGWGDGTAGGQAHSLA